MRYHTSEPCVQNQASARRALAGRRLQIMLWSSWTALVIATAYFSWRADSMALHRLNVVGLSVHCGVAGIIGLIVLTLIEMRLEPWRFIE